MGEGQSGARCLIDSLSPRCPLFAAVPPPLCACREPPANEEGLLLRCACTHDRLCLHVLSPPVPLLPVMSTEKDLDDSLLSDEGDEHNESQMAEHDEHDDPLSRSTNANHEAKDEADDALEESTAGVETEAASAQQSARPTAYSTATAAAPAAVSRTASGTARPASAKRTVSLTGSASAAAASASSAHPAGPSSSASSAAAPDAESLEIQKRIAIQSKRREDELARQKQEEEKEFPVGFHYRDDSDELCRYLKPFELSPEYINLHVSFGYASQRRQNIHYIDFGVLIFMAGNTVQILDLFQDQNSDHRKKTVLLGQGRDSNTGIGALAVHPSKQYFAVAEKGTNPNIYVYNYPNKEVIRILSKGTERAYADLQFSHTGSKLVSVGCEPDFLLTVWDWARERVILRTKAFSQEVFRVCFSPVNEGRLLTSGTGHIRFWKMAKTFTGLKLQGSIGKFGNVELSDISAFVELPDGKVLSGTESGSLLMWDGNFIQFTVMRAGPTGAVSERRPCHQGMIEFVALDETNGVREIVTAGADGYVRKWRFDRLEFAEASEEDPCIALDPIVERKIGPGVQIRAMMRGDDHWIVQDYCGGLYKLYFADFQVQKLLDVHSGKINAMQPAPLRAHIAVTAGQDHTIRCWDVLQGEQLYSRAFNAPATSLLWAPASVDEEQRILLVGFGDGVVRVVKRYKDAFKLHHTFKPHTRAVTQLAISPDGLMLATAAEDGQLFFLSIAPRSKCAGLLPLGFIKLSHPPLSLNWSPDSSKLLLCSGPDVVELSRPVADEYTDPVRMAARETYEIQLPHRVYRPIIRDYKPIDPQEEDDVAEAQAAALLAAGATLGGAELDEHGALRVREPPKPKPILGVDLIYNLSACLYVPSSNGGSFFVTLDGGGNRDDPKYFPGQKIETLYECQFAPDSTPILAPVTSASAAAVAAAAAQASGPGLGGEPLRGIHLGKHVGTIHTMSISHSGKYLLLGTRNGGAQLRALDDLQYFFYTHYHDGSGGPTGAHPVSSGAQGYVSDRLGVVTSVQTTFDDRFLLSVGNDGNFFAHAIDPVQALARMDRSIELTIAAERRAAEEARLAKIKAKEEAVEQARKEEEDRLAKEAASAGKKDARTREQKDREARELKEKELRDRERKEREDREREARLKLKEERKNDPEKDDENFDHLRTRIPARSLTKLPLPDAALAQEKLESKAKASVAAAAAAASSGSAAASLDDDALDIVDPKSYSIEEAKLKQEEDDRLLAAEKKKSRMRLEIAELRKEFVFLLRRNAGLDKTQQLPRDAFELDPKLRAELEAEAQAKIDEVRAELAWVSEKHSLALQKLRAKFLDHLVVEHIELRAFNSGVKVSCFRTPELPPFLKHAIEHVHRMMESEENLRTQQEQQMQLSSQTAGGADAADDAARGSGLRGALKARATAKGSAGSAGRHRPAGITEAELRKQARAERAVQLARLKAAKPDKNTDDPADVAAVQFAEKHMGDYKLKSDPKYIVPEHQRVNAERKRRQMVLLQESVHYIKMALNERFLALRDLKARIIKNIKKDNVRLRVLNANLGIVEDLFEPELDPEEWPEHRELFTREDLAQFESEREKERVRAVNVGSRSIFSSAHGSFDEPEEKKSELAAANAGDKAAASASGAAAAAASKDKKSTPSSISEESGADGGSSSSADSDSKSAGGAAAKSAAAASVAVSGPKSSMESTEQSIQAKLWSFERTSLLEKISFALWSFDQALLKLRREKLKLDSDLKSTDLKLLTLYQELYLLKDFEENENKLFAKLTKARSNKAQVVGEMSDCERSLSHKLSEIKAWQEKDKQVMLDFNLVVGGEKSEFYGQLLKIFKKKVKRNKKKAGGAGGGGAAGGRDGADDDDGDDSDLDNGGGNSSASSSDDDNSDSNESDDDSCPLHLESSIYEKVLELREKRLEQEEILMDFNKTVLELNKSYERLGGRERLIDKELQSTENEIEAFQSEKQRALNLIEVAIPLKINQMKYLATTAPAASSSDGGGVVASGAGKLPKDISQALIFTSTGLRKLQHRILELSSEKSNLHRQFRELKKQHKSLLKEQSVIREGIAQEKENGRRAQEKKFGRVIDLAILEKVGVQDDASTELHQKLDQLERGAAQAVRKSDLSLEQKDDQLARITEQNTRWLDKVAKLTKAQYDLEDQLNTTTKNVHVADSSPLDEQVEMEQRQLLELVELQKKELEALKAEVHVLRRKGGHVYTPQA